MPTAKDLLEASILDLLAPDARVQADFLGLAEHIGIDPQEALTDALNHWVGSNADLFGYRFGTDLTPDHTKETTECHTLKN